MKAVRVHKDDASCQLKIEDVPKPTPGPGELLVQIKASFVQPADILNSKGSFAKTTFPRILGKDFSGIVVQGSEDWKGKEVYGTSGFSFSFTEDGAQAEFAVLKETAVARKPKNLSFAQAAAIGTPWTTGLTTLRRARTTPADTVMVLGATGAVGSSVMQLARRMGCSTIGVGRHGTDIVSSDDPQLSQAKQLAGESGVNVVVDTTGNVDLINAALAIMATGGRMAVIAAPRQGSTELPLDLLAFYRGQKELVGCNTAAAPQSDMALLMRDMTADFEAGTLVPPDKKTLNLLSIDQAEDAYSRRVKRAVIVFE